MELENPFPSDHWRERELVRKEPIVVPPSSDTPLLSQPGQYLVEDEKPKGASQCSDQLLALSGEELAPALEIKEPLLPELSPGDDIEVYLSTFEHTADACQWPRGEWVMRLVPTLTGKAHEAYRSLDPRDAGDYKKVKAAILCCYDISAETQRKQFRQFRYQEAEGPQEVYCRLWDLCHRWLEPESRTKEQILELLILEQFLAILPPEILSWVRERGPKTCAQAVALAELFQMGKQEAGMWEEQITVQVKDEEGTSEEMESSEALWESDSQLESQIKEELHSVPGKESLDLQKTGVEILSQMEKQPNQEEPESLVLSRMLQRGSVERLSHKRGRRKFSKRQKRSLIGTDVCPRFPVEGKPKPTREQESNITMREKRHQYKDLSETWNKSAFTAHDKDPPFTCSECRKSFNHLTHLKAHLQTHTGETPYSCGECGENFADLSILIVHQKLHVGEHLYSCNECERTFTSPSDMKKHKQSHTKEQLYPCSECGKSFNRLTHLKTHQRTHTGEKPYSCGECGKNFGHLSTLITHQRLHTGERPYSCAACEKTFTNPSDLNKHRRLHSGERPYPCSECGKCFSQLSNLMTHHRTHTEDRPYPCEECGKSFKYPAYLAIHKRSHTGERPFPCSQCGKGFSNKSSLARHQRIHFRTATKGK
uniref:Uncharacterized protein n=1 Tax=Sphenodon punctatus TaxID=8508 RepID=A0A8D0L4Z3_SPHPU